ncbi:NUDIX hydrolase [Sinomonas sp. ASV486]|uniref:NUDIX hydrolase n=1 Tax=Sinomonas sp. ASV486 TaxID=3051170 RepID=UPI0027DD5E6F|nr:NUDIX hydrolase [Sinomonas sp. ASV486]MDQ4489043.1 NUDIX hydrolase [Sinomonas sp. ASV486]
MVWRDEHGKRLEDYPRPSVAVDTAVLTVDGGRLTVLLAGGALPGTFIHPGETLADAVLRSLRDKAGVSGRSPRQLRVFDRPARDPRGWVLSVAHVDVVSIGTLTEALMHDGVRLAPVGDASVLGGLPYEQEEIVAAAVESVRREYRAEPDPCALLDEPFTLAQLRTLHTQVLDEDLMRDTFRRYMEPRLKGTGEMTDGTRGRPSRLWRRPMGQSPHSSKSTQRDYS